MLLTRVIIIDYSKRDVHMSLILSLVAPLVLATEMSLNLKICTFFVKISFIIFTFSFYVCILNFQVYIIASESVVFSCLLKHKGHETHFTILSSFPVTNLPVVYQFSLFFKTSFSDVFFSLPMQNNFFNYGAAQ